MINLSLVQSTQSLARQRILLHIDPVAIGEALCLARKFLSVLQVVFVVELVIALLLTLYTQF